MRLSELDDLSDDEVRRLGMSAVSSALGPAGLIRFLHLLGACHGDYAAEKLQQPETDMETLLADLRKLREEQLHSASGAS